MPLIIWILKLIFAILIEVFSSFIGFLLSLVLLGMGYLTASLLMGIGQLTCHIIKDIGPLALTVLLRSLLFIGLLVITPVIIGVFVLASAIFLLGFLIYCAGSALHEKINSHNSALANSITITTKNIFTFFSSLFLNVYTLLFPQKDLDLDCSHLEKLTRLQPKPRPPLLTEKELISAKENATLHQKIESYQTMLEELKRDESLMGVPFKTPILLVKEYKNAKANHWESEPGLFWKFEFDVLKKIDNKNPYVSEPLSSPQKYKQLQTRYSIFAPTPESKQALTTDLFNQTLTEIRAALENA